MTKTEIIMRIQASARPYEHFCLDDDVREAMAQCTAPLELVDAILEIIGTNPTTDFGMPGDLVHFVERFYRKGYEELLIASVYRHPTAHNIWMVHRCFNDRRNPLHEEFAKLIESVRNDTSVPAEVKETIDSFQFEQ